MPPALNKLEPPAPNRLRQVIVRMLPWVTGVWVLLELLSLRLGLLNRFFFDSMHADVQAIDYFSLPKAFLTLQAGRSEYDSFGPPAYGPHLTWYLSHPLLGATLGSLLSQLEPMDSYGLFTFLSLGVMALCAWLLARESSDPLTRRLLWLLLLGAFPTYSMLYTGNVQALPVLGLTMLLVALYRLAFAGSVEEDTLILAGLLVSLFTKPLVFPMLPLLLLLKPARRATTHALGIYVAVSLLFEVVPALNPQGVGLARVLWLSVHPAFVQTTMNIYANQFHLTPDMLDNSIHWLNLVAQSGVRLVHIDTFSLPVLLDGMLGARTPDWIYALPSLLVLGLSFRVASLHDRGLRLQAALLLAMAAALLFFLTYPTVWEYQYTAVLPIAGVLLLLRQRNTIFSSLWPWCMALGACAFLPSLYIFTEGHPPTATVLTIIHGSRVLPVLLLFVLLIAAVLRIRQAAPQASAVAAQPPS